MQDVHHVRPRNPLHRRRMTCVTSPTALQPGPPIRTVEACWPISDSCTDRALSDGEKTTISNGLYLYYLNPTGDVTCDRTIQYAF